MKQAVLEVKKQRKRLGKRLSTRILTVTPKNKNPSFKLNDISKSSTNNN